MPDQYDIKRFTAFLKKRHAHLRVWASKNGIECYRIYHRNMGNIPFFIDMYGKYLNIVVNEEAGTTVSETEMTELVSTVGKTLYIPEDRIFLKYRERLKNKQQYKKYSSDEVWISIEEYGLNFHINLSDYLDTGLFLDHRDARAMVRENATGLRVLNLFAYTGSFSVYAAAGGALSTTTVDLSNVYLEWAKRNMSANGFVNSAHEYINEDVFKFLSNAEKQDKKWDLIILDPPTFSNSRKMDNVLDIQKDHVSLISLCLKLLTKKGSIIFSNNSKRFKMDAAFQKKHHIQDITNDTMPEDFIGTKIHKCWIIRK